MAYLTTARVEEPPVTFAFSPPDGVRLADLPTGGPVTISPGGRLLAFVATGADGRQLLWVRSLDSLAAQALPDTDGAAYPFWAPDSRSIGFFAQRKLKKVEVSGGPPQALCDAIQPRGGTWNHDGVIVFSANAATRLYRVPAAGGAATPLPVGRPNQRIYWPQFLPDGRHFLYFERPEQPGTYVASLDSNDTKLIASGRSAAAYVSPGYAVFLDESQYSGAATLMAQPFDARRLQFTGEPSPVAERIASDSLYARGAFSASDNGTLVYARSEASVSQLTWFDRAGRQLTTLGPPAVYTQPVLSPGWPESGGRADGSRNRDTGHLVDRRDAQHPVSIDVRSGSRYLRGVVAGRRSRRVYNTAR